MTDVQKKHSYVIEEVHSAFQKTDAPPSDPADNPIPDTTQPSPVGCSPDTVESTLPESRHSPSMQHKEAEGKEEMIVDGPLEDLGSTPEAPRPEAPEQAFRKWSDNGGSSEGPKLLVKAQSRPLSVKPLDLMQHGSSAAVIPVGRLKANPSKPKAKR